MRLFCSGVSICAGLGALLFATAAAQAAEYQVYRDANCSSNAQCGINFAPVPAGKTLRIDNLSCYLAYSNEYALGAMQLVVVNLQNGSRDFAVTPNMHFQSSTQIGGSDYVVYASNDTIRAVGRPGQRFRAYAQVYDFQGNVGTVDQLLCGISGTIN